MTKNSDYVHTINKINSLAGARPGNILPTYIHTSYMHIHAYKNK